MANLNDDAGLPSTHLLQDSSDKHTHAQAKHIETHTKGSKAFPKATWVFHLAIVIISAVTPVAATIVWLAVYSADKEHGSFSAFSGERIGGKLSQSQAKAVDVLCSAILGPCFVAGLNYFWFGCARVSAVNEKHPRSHSGVPFSSLIAVSTSVGGSYDFSNLATLLHGRTWRLSLLAALTLLSAIAKSAVSNIIAYEAYMEVSEQTDTLRSLSDRYIKPFYIPSANNFMGLPAGPTDITFNFTTSQQSAVANQITGLLTGLNFEDATAKLDHGAYVGANCTSGSMDSISPNVIRLFNVPGFRLTVDCTPDQPDILSLIAMGGYVTMIEPMWTAGMFQAFYPGLPADIQGSYNDYYQFAAFLFPNNTEVYLGYLTSFNISGGAMSSPYGDIKPRSINMTASGFSGTKSIMSYWGIRCWLNREDGYLNYTRNNGRWSLSESHFIDKTAKVSSSLANWQTKLNYHAPGAAIPGIGPALAKTAGQTQCSQNQCDNATDFSKLALNYLYASAESERILYEVVASNSSNDQPERWYNVSSAATHEYYRITYIPAILIVSIISLFAAAGATIGMMLYAFKTYSMRTFRQVDVLRLVVDCIDGLQEANVEKEITNLPRDELDSWASRCRVAYDKEDDISSPALRIRKAH